MKRSLTYVILTHLLFPLTSWTCPEMMKQHYVCKGPAGNWNLSIEKHSGDSSGGLFYFVEEFSDQTEHQEQDVRIGNFKKDFKIGQDAFCKANALYIPYELKDKESGQSKNILIIYEEKFANRSIVRQILGVSSEEIICTSPRKKRDRIKNRNENQQRRENKKEHYNELRILLNLPPSSVRIILKETVSKIKRLQEINRHLHEIKRRQEEMQSIVGLSEDLRTVPVPVVENPLDALPDISSYEGTSFKVLAQKRKRSSVQSEERTELKKNRQLRRKLDLQRYHQILRDYIQTLNQLIDASGLSEAQTLEMSKSYILELNQKNEALKAELQESKVSIPSSVLNPPSFSNQKERDNEDSNSDEFEDEDSHDEDNIDSDDSTHY